MKNELKRLKNHLSYRLGCELLRFSQNELSFAKLGFNFLKIFLSHKRRQGFSKKMTQVFPQLKDKFEESPASLVFKQSFQYRSGSAFLASLKRGGGIKFLRQDLQRLKNECEKFEEFKENLAYFDIILEKLDFLSVKKLIEKHKDLSQILELLRKNNNSYFNINCIDELIKRKNEVLEWILSAEFKQKYENHPAPPLLKSFSYEKIDAKSAYKLNLPLPQNYKSISVIFGLSGHFAFVRFLKRMGIRSKNTSFDDELSLSSHSIPLDEVYEELYECLKNESLDTIFYLTWIEDNKERLKFLSLLNAKVPVVVLVRDPISRLKTGVNHGFFKNCEKNTIYDIDDDLRKLVDRIAFYGRENYPNLKELDNAYKGKSAFCGDPKIFTYTSTVSALNPSKILYIDTKDIMPENAYLNLVKLGEEMGLKLKELDERENYGAGRFIYLLPIRLKITPDLIILVRHNLFELSSEFKLDISAKLNLNLRNLKIGFFMQEKSFEKLLKNDFLLHKTKKKLNAYIELLDEKISSIKAACVSEKDVLEYLASKPDLCKIYKTYFDKEFKHIKENRKDIVQNWQYYNEFEKICQNLEL